MVRPLGPRTGEAGHGPHKLPPVPRLSGPGARQHHDVAVQGAPRRHGKGQASVGGAAAAAGREGPQRQEGRRPGRHVHHIRPRSCQG